MLHKCDVKAGNLIDRQISLFDWRSRPAFRDLAIPATYSRGFTFSQQAGKQYILDLGVACFTANVIINGKPAGKKIWNPYRLDITNYLNKGKNLIVVEVMPVLRNHCLSEAQKGNPFYANYKEAGKTYMPGGLIGPVIITEQ